jgi:hypothetical protein
MTHPLSIQASIIRDKETEMTGLRIEFYPMPREISEVLFEVLRVTATEWLIEVGAVEPDAIMMELVKRKGPVQ